MHYFGCVDLFYALPYVLWWHFVSCKIPISPGINDWFGKSIGWGICLSVFSLLNHWQSLFQVVNKSYRSQIRPDTYVFHILIHPLPPACSVAVIQMLSFTIILRNPYASLRCQIPSCLGHIFSWNTSPAVSCKKCIGGTFLLKHFAWEHLLYPHTWILIFMCGVS